MVKKHKILLFDYVGELFSNDQKAENSQLVLPVGLMYLSSYLKSKLDNLDLKLIKSYVDFHGDDAMVTAIEAFKPDVLGIRCLSLDVGPLLKSVAKIRKSYHKDGFIIVLGGPVTNAETGKVYDSGLFDQLVVNEGEHAFYEIVKSHIDGRPVPAGIRGVVYNVDQVAGDLIQDLDALPYPDYDLIDFSKYDNFLNYGYNRLRQGVMVTSRGCPYRCIYCHNIMGRTARLRSPDSVFGEMVYLHEKYQIHDFFIVDDIFNINYDRAMTIFDLIIASNMKINLYFPNGIRGDIIDIPYIDKMVEAGGKYVSFAIETGSQRLQSELRKRVKLAKLKDLIHYTCDKDIMVNGFFMFGIPNETEEDALMTIRYAEELEKLHFPYIFFARYYEGTEMHTRAKEIGFSEEMIHNSINQVYHNIENYSTPTLSNDFVKWIKNYWLYKIIFKKQRIQHVLKVERKFHSESQTLDMIHSMYNIKVNSVHEFDEYVGMISKSTFAAKWTKPIAPNVQAVS